MLLSPSMDSSVGFVDKSSFSRLVALFAGLDAALWCAYRLVPFCPFRFNTFISLSISFELHFSTMVKKRKSRASAGDGEDSKKRSKSTSTAMERQISGSSAGQASAQSTTADSEQEETCPRCPSGKPPQPSAYPPEIAGKGDTPAMLRQAEKEGEDGIDLPWIGCTKCKTWYHAACLVLDGMPTLNAEAARNGSGESEQAAQMQVDVKEEVTGAPQEEEEEVVNGRKTLPEELLTTVDERGYWWDWTYRVDKW